MTMNDVFLKSLLTLTTAAFALGAQAQDDEPAAVVTSMTVLVSAQDRFRLQERYEEPAAVVEDMVVLASPQDRLRAQEGTSQHGEISEAALADSRKHVADAGVRSSSR